MDTIELIERRINDKLIKVLWNDGPNVTMNYMKFREQLPEEICLDAIETLKKKTGKKVAIIFGNCQTIRLREFLMSHTVFNMEYFFIELPAVCDYNNETAFKFHEGFWKLCDLFISQHISTTNKFHPLLATRPLLQEIPETTKVIWIPNVYFTGYFPQYLSNTRNVDTHLHPAGRFPHADKYIDQWISANHFITLPSLRTYITEQSFISESQTKKNMDDSFNELKRHEWLCDIHMLDFVADNYKRTQLFFSPNHPTQSVMLELAHRILKFMDISDMSFYDMNRLFCTSLIGQDIPVYPSVAKILGLQEYFTNAYANTNVWDFHAGYEDFLIEYAKWIWKDHIME